MKFIKDITGVKLGDNFLYEGKVYKADKLCIHGHELLAAAPTHALQIREGYYACKEVLND